MEPKLKFENGPMDQFVKKNHGHQSSGEGSPPSTSQRSAKEEETHEAHSFEWTWSKTTTSTSCKKAGTVEDSPKTKLRFKKIAKTNKNKELVIVRDGKAISSHFPCSLIGNDRLNVRYVKAVNKLKKTASGSKSLQRKGSTGELVIFHLQTQGGKNVERIMENPALKTEFREISIYAYKGEKVKEALRRDGRLLNEILKKDCVLSNIKDQVQTEMSCLVDDLNDKTFRIILRSHSLRESQTSSLEDADWMQDENKEPPQHETTVESVKENMPKNNTTGSMAIVTRIQTIQEIPNSKKMNLLLSSQIKEGVKQLGGPNVLKQSQIPNLLPVKYGKNVQRCSEVEKKKLRNLSDSVCQVRINGSPGGSGSLLFDKFVLTNGHVVRDIYDETSGELQRLVTVHFSFESLEGDQQSGVEVEGVAGYEYCPDVSGPKSDWALLKLRADQTLPDGLLKHFGFLPIKGGIYIIGHPDGGVKKIDPCFIIPYINRNQIVLRHHQENPKGVVVEDRDYGEYHSNFYFEGVAKSLEYNKQRLYYESHFYDGSSGSPVFDEYCNVIAMHSGGYCYRNERSEKRSVIEYGHPLSAIIENMVIQVVEKGRFDVLKQFLAFPCEQHKNFMNNLKKLVESRNLTTFKTAINNPVVTSDEKLKEFFEFLTPQEEPMDIN